jgi:branched-chain amino acid transport system permease protein
MPEQLFQFLVTGITVGSLYALVGLGFALIYNASDVVNFAQGEFVMLGAMTAIALLNAGLAAAAGRRSLPPCSRSASVCCWNAFAIEPAAGASVVTTIIITIGAAIFLRGVALLLWGKDFHALKPFSGDAPIRLGRCHGVAAKSVGARCHRRAGALVRAFSSTAPCWVKRC